MKFNNICLDYHRHRVVLTDDGSTVDVVPPTGPGGYGDESVLGAGGILGDVDGRVHVLGLKRRQTWELLGPSWGTVVDVSESPRTHP